MSAPAFWRRLTARSHLGAWLLFAAWALIILVLIVQPDIGEAGGRRFRIGGPAIGHAAFFGVLGFVGANAVVPLGIRRGRWWLLVTITLYGIACELVQAGIPGRTPSVVDLGADVLGAYAGLLAWLALARWYGWPTIDPTRAMRDRFESDAPAKPATW